MKIGQRIRCKSTSLEGVVTKVDGEKVYFRSVDGCIRSRHIRELVVSYYRTRVPLMEKRIADLERRLREAEGQLKAQRDYPQMVTVRGEPTPARRILAENAELRRTISLMAKTAAEVQDNFRLIAELAADPADEARKEPKP